MKKQFWAVEVAHKNHHYGTSETVYVTAGSAARAETRALALCRKKKSQEEVFGRNDLSARGFYAMKVTFQGVVW